MLTVMEFAKEKECSRQTIYNAIKRGELDAIKRHSTTLIRETKRNKLWKPDDSKR